MASFRQSELFDEYLEHARKIAEVFGLEEPDFRAMFLKCDSYPKIEDQLSEGATTAVAVAIAVAVSCSVCRENFPAGVASAISCRCGAAVHRECLTHQLSVEGFNSRCPSCSRHRPLESFDESGIELAESFANEMIKRHPRYSRCTNCQRILRWRYRHWTSSPRITCACGASVCIACGVDHFPVENCSQVVSWNRENLKGSCIGRVRACPNCKTLFTHDEGCNSMHCSHCGTAFCWNCGVLQSKCEKSCGHTQAVEEKFNPREQVDLQDAEVRHVTAFSAYNVKFMTFENNYRWFSSQSDRLSQKITRYWRYLMWLAVKCYFDANEGKTAGNLELVEFQELVERLVRKDLPEGQKNNLLCICDNHLSDAGADV
ncbi:MAG: Rcat domain-containing protein [Sulfobacillus sp.]